MSWVEGLFHLVSSSSQFLMRRYRSPRRVFLVLSRPILISRLVLPRLVRLTHPLVLSSGSPVYMVASMGPRASSSVSY